MILPNTATVVEFRVISNDVLIKLSLGYSQMECNMCAQFSVFSEVAGTHVVGSCDLKICNYVLSLIFFGKLHVRILHGIVMVVSHMLFISITPSWKRYMK